MRVVLAPDKFKGSLTAREAAKSLAAGLSDVAPDWELVAAPVADGGDGLVDAISGQGFDVRTAKVTGSLGQPRTVRYAVRGGTAVIELAEADGLRLLEPAARRPLDATSRGVGELVLAALDDGCRDLVLGLGGSANTDGGAGLVQALGGRLLDADGRDVGPGGGALRRLGRVDLDGLDRRLGGTAVTVASDVDNPLLGPTGAATVYAPQKGATPEHVGLLEAGLRRWATLLAEPTGRDLAAAPGAGAAGGVGFAALTVLDARLRPGIEVVLDLIGFDRILDGADLVVTGEGSLDEQSLHGKAPVGVGAAAARRRVPVVAVAGRCTLTAGQLRSSGFATVHTLTEREPDPVRCLTDAARLVRGIGRDIARAVQLDQS